MTHFYSFILSELPGNKKKKKKKKTYSLYFCNGYLDVFCLMFYEHIYETFWRKDLMNLSSAPHTQKYISDLDPVIGSSLSVPKWVLILWGRKAFWERELNIVAPWWLAAAPSYLSSVKSYCTSQCRTACYLRKTNSNNNKKNKQNPWLMVMVCLWVFVELLFLMELKKGEYFPLQPLLELS